MRHLKWITGTIAGATIGFGYWYFIGCNSGACAITSSPINSTIYGGLMGLLLVNSFSRNTVTPATLLTQPTGGLVANSGECRDRILLRLRAARHTKHLIGSRFVIFITELLVSKICCIASKINKR